MLNYSRIPKLISGIFLNAGIFWKALNLYRALLNLNREEDVTSIRRTRRLHDSFLTFG